VAIMAVFGNVNFSIYLLLYFRSSHSLLFWCLLLRG
jgi:hypothetical protein